MVRVCVGGGAGFIGSHLCKKLKDDGHYVIAADVQTNSYFKAEQFCNEFRQVDLRSLENCLKVRERVGRKQSSFLFGVPPILFVFSPCGA